METFADILPRNPNWIHFNFFFFADGIFSMPESKKCTFLCVCYSATLYYDLRHNVAYEVISLSIWTCFYTDVTASIRFDAIVFVYPSIVSTTRFTFLFWNCNIEFQRSELIIFRSFSFAVSVLLSPTSLHLFCPWQYSVMVWRASKAICSMAFLDECSRTIKMNDLTCVYRTFCIILANNLHCTLRFEIWDSIWSKNVISSDS